jgi:hypothetical protein
MPWDILGVSFNPPAVVNDAADVNPHLFFDNSNPAYNSTPTRLILNMFRIHQLDRKPTDSVADQWSRVVRRSHRKTSLRRAYNSTRLPVELS